MKRCTCCGLEKSLDAFSKQLKGKFGVTSVCKPCTSERGKAWAKLNPERRRAVAQAWLQKNQERAEATRKVWAARNGERERRRLQVWAQENKAACTAKLAKRRAAKLRATPDWADLEQIKVIYGWAKECTRLTGIQAHVDHIVPLVSDLVCGLHCPANLLVRTAASNRSKHNKWDVNATFYP